jgi:hypothetical protein
MQNFNPSKTDISVIRKINLKDGSCVDFKDSSNPNKLLQMDTNVIVYEDKNGGTHTISSSEIYQALYGELVVWRSALFIIGIITAVCFIFFPSVTKQPVI